jgi:hypothetical protein
MQKVKEFFKKVWANDQVKRVVHTAWQAAGGVLISGLLAAHSPQDVKSAVFVAGAAALAAVKAYFVGRRG